MNPHTQARPGTRRGAGSKEMLTTTDVGRGRLLRGTLLVTLLSAALGCGLLAYSVASSVEEALAVAHPEAAEDEMEAAAALAAGKVAKAMEEVTMVAEARVYAVCGGTKVATAVAIWESPGRRVPTDASRLGSGCRRRLEQLRANVAKAPTAHPQ